MQTVTGGMNYNFSDANSTKVSKYGRITSANCCQRRQLFRCHSILLEDEGQYNDDDYVDGVRLRL
jgi:hypothetical protein